MVGKIKIVGFAGSLRKESYNKAILRASAALVPPDAELYIFDLEGIPVFNQDLESSPPKRVREFKDRVKSADAILIATPEYNYSIPGVLKNAMDWASRPYPDNSFKGKPVAIMSASGSTIGGERAQLALRQTFVYLDMHPVNKPEVIVTFVSQKVDEKGNLTDEGTRQRITELLEALVDFAKKLS